MNSCECDDGSVLKRDVDVDDDVDDDDGGGVDRGGGCTQ